MICELCDARCCKDRIITITIFDAIRIMKNAKIKFEDFAVFERPRLLNLDYNELIKCKENGVEQDFILTIKSHPCVFLKNNRCSIYEYAPMVCKLYPFNSEGNYIEGALCPIQSKILFKFRGVEKKIVEQFKKEEAEWRKLIKKWNLIAGTKEECKEYLIKEGMKVALDII